jgi:CheY-like chemotaxis protein
MGPLGVVSPIQRGRGRRLLQSGRLLATRICAGRVLVVDDEDDLRDSLAEFLEDEGYDVAQATDGREALDRLAEIERPCWVLLDLFMPRMDGFEFLEVLTRNDAAAEDVHVVVMTAAPTEAPDDVPVLAKPASAADVLEALDGGTA